jgi:hypothetical protein
MDISGLEGWTYPEGWGHHCQGKVTSACTLHRHESEEDYKDLRNYKDLTILWQWGGVQPKTSLLSCIQEDAKKRKIRARNTINSYIQGDKNSVWTDNGKASMQEHKTRKSIKACHYTSGRTCHSLQRVYTGLHLLFRSNTHHIYYNICIILTS